MKLSLLAGLALALLPVSAEARDISDADAAALRAGIEAGEFGGVTSVLVMNHGAVDFEEYYAGADPETRHDTRSATKTITGMAAGLAIAEGALAIDTLLLPLFPDVQPVEHPDPRKAAITPYDLLTMSGPLECNDWESFSRGNEERMYFVEDWAGFYWDLPIAAVRPWEIPAGERPHGRVFSYCTAGVQILGAAVARAAGQPLDDYLQTRLFDPLGIPRPGWQRLAETDAFAGGGLRLRTRDLAALAELYRNGGRHEGTQILPEDWVSLSMREHVVLPDNPGQGYGFLWWRRAVETEDGSVTAVEMMGNGGNRISIIPERGLVIVITKTDFNTSGMHQRTNELIDAILASDPAD